MYSAPRRLSERLSVFRALSARLAALDDARLRMLLTSASPPGHGIGGTTAAAEVDGVKIFIKRIPVAELELLSVNRGSTANLFDLPLHYHYRLGSNGFGAWRETAVHEMTTSWVLNGDYTGFPLTYHTRVLPEDPRSSDPEGRGRQIQQLVETWGGDHSIRARLEALDCAPASVVVFLEYLPQTLDDWLHRQVREGGATLGEALEYATGELEAGIEFMGAHGLIHFDSHRFNILTDGSTFYFADYGLALSRSFGLSPEEEAFLTAHADYDWMVTIAEVLNGVGGAVRGVDHYAELARDYAQGGNPDALPQSAAAYARRYAPAAVALNSYLRRMIQARKTAPYPAEEFYRARLAATDAASRQHRLQREATDPKDAS